MRQMSNKGREHLKHFEGLHLVAYLDAAGIPTIGWGHTKGVKAGDRITREKAEKLLDDDINDHARCVARLLDKAIFAGLKQGQYDALVSFVFNVGCGAFERSTMRKMLNSGEHERAASEFPRWNKGGGKVLAGLTRRRAAEKRMYMEAA